MVSIKRPEVANRIHDAKEHGDLSENAEYEDAKNEQAFVEGRIQTLEALIKNATIIDENHSTDARPDRLDRRGREPRRQGSLHHRRLRRGQARRGPDLEREPGRARPARARRRARRSSSRSRPATSPTRSSASPKPRGGAHGLGGRARVPGQRPAGRQRLEDAVGDGPRRQPARSGHPRRHHPRAARQRTRDDAALRRRRHGPDGCPGAADPRRDRSRDGPAAGPRARPDRGRSRQLRAPLREHLRRHLRRSRHPPRSLLLDERHLPDRSDGSVHPDRARSRRPRPRDLPPRRERPASRHVAPARGRLPDLRQGRHDDRHRLGRRARSSTSAGRIS